MIAHKSRARAIGDQLFSTKSFVPGHVVGTAILAIGTIAVAKAFLAAARAQANSPAPPESKELFLLHVPPHATNERGQYGKKP